jgi:hypothetical protein
MFEKYIEEKCVVIDVITRKEEGNEIIPLWSEVVQTDNIVEILLELQQYVQTEFMLLEDNNYISEASFKLENLTFLKVDCTNFLTLLDSKQEKPYLKILVRNSTFQAKIL